MIDDNGQITQMLFMSQYAILYAYILWSYQVLTQLHELWAKQGRIIYNF